MKLAQRLPTDLREIGIWACLIIEGPASGDGGTSLNLLNTDNTPLRNTDNTNLKEDIV